MRQRVLAIVHWATRFRAWTPALIAALIISALGPPATAKEKSGPWEDVIRGSSTPLLRGSIHPGLPWGWRVYDGVLSKSGPVEDLESTRKYRDFELELQWKLGKGGNSGIFYRGTHQYDHIYWTALEYQLLDDAGAEDGKSRLTAAGSVYDLYPCPAGVVHLFGRWNTSRIRMRGEHVEQWLNGRKVVDFILGSADWKSRLAASKFAKVGGFASAPEGLIGLQGDHPGDLEIRRFRIRVLP